MLREKFSKKKSLLDANFRAIKLGYDYAMQHFACPLPFHLERMDATKDELFEERAAVEELGLLG